MYDSREPARRLPAADYLDSAAESPNGRAQKEFLPGGECKFPTGKRSTTS